MNDENLTPCDENQILEYATGSLDDVQRAEIEAHLETCESCCEILAEWRDLSTSVQMRANHETFSLPPLPLKIFDRNDELLEQNPMTIPLTASLNHASPLPHPRLASLDSPSPYTERGLGGEVAHLAERGLGGEVSIQRRGGEVSRSRLSLPITLIAACCALFFGAIMILGGSRSQFPALSATQTQEEPATIYEILHDNPRFDLFAQLVDQNEWAAEILAGDEPVTLFVLSDLALSPLMERLDSVETANALVWSHLINDAWSRERLEEVARVNSEQPGLRTTLTGDWQRGTDEEMHTGVVPNIAANGLLIVEHPEDVTTYAVVDNTQKEILASNGIIYIVNAPILPQDMLYPPLEFMASQTLYNRIRTNPKWSLFGAAIDRSRFVTDILQGPGDATVFVMRDEVLMPILGDGKLDELSLEQIEGFLLPHILQGLWSTHMLSDIKSVRSQWEHDGYSYQYRITAAYTSDTRARLRLNGRAEVIGSELMLSSLPLGDGEYVANMIASNGIYHVINVPLVVP